MERFARPSSYSRLLPVADETPPPDSGPSFASYLLLYGGVFVLLTGLALGMVLLLRAGR